ncbi:single-stranded-DNA-specific exonuclease RecJ [Candidatus Kaiserbacteria bacterium RIFCSPLOWO2_02_FULL_56_11]|uniref:Single-stranded-DNA-specific exonuclease RecJ n=2 Tax=Candidatus Kaiseribacteriota TaxID=1752734 RepID=A0A1F6E4V0_9BACT|nr:MAG: single-stranded-DNA-specific exonuclease RecJ [Candidatus Kaiserbacteria bacterium RIFCSPHIGHO2_02_FULL_56_30]OGG72395.1 MAG: single-stranded-DNA-specific exonuclease RecJ [Candidatus Kaiserbacteria bacterium RIFCSPHIGHO2_12_FULL_56_13]OGG81597.1 MAG: single-stranded-DNA-specific exonuclease RecJ [Candidatus Kaiserbacteria bacterium RIFCSPLOWO2_02_FULL_56_11]
MPDDFTLMLLRRRGIETKDEIEKFLNPSYDLHLHDPLLMKNMRGAAQRLAAAIKSGERIAVWSDYDCDGIPAAVLLHDFLEKAEANFENYIPHRHEEGYGVNTEGIEKLAESGAKLIVTADVGITDVGAVARARELGVEVIVTDHHLPGDELPDAIVVDDKQKGETYPFPELCGAATAWKLVCAILAVAPELREKIPVGWEKWLLDMAGLATIADMMPLVGENRVIATYGLKVLRKSPRIGLQKLCRVMRVNQSTLTEDDVGFMIAPRVNAASRMGDAWDAFNLFTATDEVEAEALARKLDKANRERKAQAGAITRAVHTRLKSRTSIPTVIALGDPAWRPSLLGLVASGIAEEYERPVFLWGREGNQSLKGSCRSDGRVHVIELMTATTEVFAEFGGHAGSGGFTVRDDQIFYLEERLVEAHTRVEVAELSQREYEIDARISPDQADESLLAKVERLAPFGEKNEKPLFLFRECEIARISRFGKGNEHLKIEIARPFGALEAVSFFAKGDLAKAAHALSPHSRVNLVGHLERDQFSRRGGPRLRLIGIAPV